MSRDGIEPSLKDFQSNALPLSYSGLYLNGRNENRTHVTCMQNIYSATKLYSQNFNLKINSNLMTEIGLEPIAHGV